MKTLETKYMGLELRNPVIVGSSGLTAKVENIKKIEEAGAGAVVLKSIFEEQFLADEQKLMDKDDKYFWFPEAIEFINDHSKKFGLKEYVELIREAKEAVNIPIIASVNCISAKEWPKYALQLESAGADGIELNISVPSYDKTLSSEDIETRYIEILQKVKAYVSIPVAVKLGPYFTNITRISNQLMAAGADALVLFNRQYTPNINTLTEIAESENIYSTSLEMSHSLRWVSLLSKEFPIDLSASTGIHNSNDILKQLLAGASTVQLCSTLYKNGIDHIIELLQGVEKWMTEKEYEKIEDFKGKVAEKIENTAAFERVQFLKKSYGKVLS